MARQAVSAKVVEAFRPRLESVGREVVEQDDWLRHSAGWDEQSAGALARLIGVEELLAAFVSSACWAA